MDTLTGAGGLSNMNGVNTIVHSPKDRSSVMTTGPGIHRQFDIKYVALEDCLIQNPATLLEYEIQSLLSTENEDSQETPFKCIKGRSLVKRVSTNDGLRAGIRRGAYLTKDLWTNRQDQLTPTYPD
ncbi:hypothetical protein HYALB_00004875 [Hymenoscyphus albidus]|uniref:Uncharacterized protein n=1 Tax=Hymenoscyphus albidus TaxID=595503 RepID=A0A9N9QC54_9HELO|nr:hypothetical protein HYALB_00004875 [Hymenoscyphus albidus]